MVSKQKKKPAQSKGKAGRPSKYRPEYCAIVRGWVKDALTQDKIADRLGIHRDTLDKWKRDYPEFSDVLKAVKDNNNEALEATIMREAIQGRQVETVILNPDKSVKEIRITKYPANAQLAMQVKAIYDPDFVPKSKLEHSGEVGVTLNIGQYKPRS